MCECQCLTASPRRHRHSPSPPQYLQLHWRALHARDAQGHAPVVDLVVRELLQQRVGDLRQAEPLVAFDYEGDDGHSIEEDCADLEKGFLSELVCTQQSVFIIKTFIDSRYDIKASLYLT